MSLRLITSAPSVVRSEDEDAAYRADLVTRYLTARSSRTRKALRAEAAAYDNANQGAPSLTDELYGASLGDVA